MMRGHDLPRAHEAIRSHQRSTSRQGRAEIVLGIGDLHTIDGLRDVTAEAS